MVCVKVGTFAGNVGECSAHLEAHDDATAEAQSDQYTYIAPPTDVAIAIRVSPAASAR